MSAGPTADAPALARRRRRALILWLMLAVIVWNGIFDFVQTRGIKEYLLRNAMHELGRGPDLPLPVAMSLVTREAIWMSTLWASAILLAGLLTIRTFTKPQRGDTSRD